VRAVDDDSQLQFYHRVLGTDFLHYGYFDQTEFDPAAMSFNDLRVAQLRYAELLLEQAQDRARPVLDVGCGMGGLLGMLSRQGFQPVALTPDRSQIRYITQAYPTVPRLHMRFEELDANEHAGRYGTVVTSESLQYLKLDQALPLLQRILAPGGRWIACDYFRRSQAPAGSGHEWSSFEQRVQREGWKFVLSRDITAHVLPALGFLHMWGGDVVAPGVDYLVQRTQRRSPGIYHLAEPSFARLCEVMRGNLNLIEPQAFAAQKSYRLMVLQRASQASSS
jgi:SAM-dependent methyltransferase